MISLFKFFTPLCSDRYDMGGPFILTSVFILSVSYLNHISFSTKNSSKTKRQLCVGKYTIRGAFVITNDSISNYRRKLQVFNRIRIIIDNFYFGFIPVYAIARNLILLIIPVNIITFMKSKIYK